jgi:hypothetical protein
MSLCEAIHGRAAMAELRSINGSMASSRERKGTEGEGAWVGVWLGEREGCRRGARRARPCCSFGSVRAAVPLLSTVRAE